MGKIRPRAIAFEPLKGTGFSPYIAAMPKNGLQPPRDTVEEGRLVRVQSLRGSTTTTLKVVG